MPPARCQRVTDSRIAGRSNQISARLRPSCPGRQNAPMDFEEALAHLLTLVGRRVEVHVFAAGESPYMVATFGGTLRAGYSMGGAPSENEAIFVRIEAGEESGSLSINREVYRGAIHHGDDSLTLQLGGVELLIAPRVIAD